MTNLSERELTIVQLVAQGLQSREIAERLGISYNTVKNHLTNIYDKLGLRSRAKLVMYAVQHGWVESESGTEATEVDVNIRERVFLHAGRLYETRRLGADKHIG